MNCQPKSRFRSGNRGRLELQFHCRRLVTLGLCGLLLTLGGCKSESPDEPITKVPKKVTNPATGEARERSEEERQVVASIQEAGGYVDQTGDAAMVDFSGPDFTDDTFEKVAYLNEHQQVEIVYVHSENLTDAGMAVFAKTPAIKQIQVSTPAVTDEGLKHLANLKKLEYLYVSEASITDAGLAHLSELVNLTTLDLMNTKITGSGLNNLSKVTKLEAVNLSDSPLTDQAMEFLAGLPNLRELYLSGTQVSDVGIQALQGHPTLINLSVTDTQVTPAGVKQLKAANPNLQVLQ